MKSLVFDAGPIISLTTNNLLWILPSLKEHFKGEFLIPEAVKSEVVDEALHTRRFRFNALQVQELIRNSTLTVVPNHEVREKTLQLLSSANKCFQAQGKNITIVHYAEIASVVLAQQRSSSALVMDERVTRELLEHPRHLAQLMEKKMRMSVTVNNDALRELEHALVSIPIIRSTELATIAFEKKLLQRYVAPRIPDSKRTLLEGVLWGLKLNGCAINERGIKAILAQAR